MDPGTNIHSYIYIYRYIHRYIYTFIHIHYITSYIPLYILFFFLMPCSLPIKTCRPTSEHREEEQATTAEERVEMSGCASPDALLCTLILKTSKRSRCRQDNCWTSTQLSIAIAYPVVSTARSKHRELNEHSKHSEHSMSARHAVPT